MILLPRGKRVSSLCQVWRLYYQGAGSNARALFFTGLGATNLELFSYNLRGTSGTGKTTVARHLLEKTSAEPIDWVKAGKPILYEGKFHHIPMYFLGSYEATCGGCDTIPSVKIVARRLRDHFSDEAPGILFFEGLMISHMLGTVGQAQIDTGLHRNILAYLDTPLDICLTRVEQRRKAAGNPNPFNPSNTIKDHERVRNNMKRAVAFRYFVTEVGHQDAIREVDRQLEALVNDLPVPGRIS